MLDFYVYEHRHPETQKPVYIGSGCRKRAWSVSSRSPEHKAWLLDCLSRGLTMRDLVFFIAEGLTKADARDLERARLQMLAPCPHFNRQGVRNSAKAVEEILPLFSVPVRPASPPASSPKIKRAKPCRLPPETMTHILQLEQQRILTYSEIGKVLKMKRNFVIEALRSQRCDVSSSNWRHRRISAQKQAELILRSLAPRDDEWAEYPPDFTMSWPRQTHNRSGEPPCQSGPPG